MRLFNSGEVYITKSLYYLYIIKNKISKETRVPILVYHNVCDAPTYSGYPPFYISTSLFKKQMIFLHRNGCSTISLHDFLLFSNGQKQLSKNSVIITFDDGYKNLYTYAFPIIKALGLSATVFLSCNHIGLQEPFPWLALKTRDNTSTRDWLPLNWNEAREMSRSGIVFGSHSMSHGLFTHMDYAKIRYEISNSKSYLEQKLGQQIDFFSFPFSYPGKKMHNKMFIKQVTQILINAGYRAACTTAIGTNSMGCNPFTLRRIQINSHDSISIFNAKLIGAYDWVKFPQSLSNFYKSAS